MHSVKKVHKQLRQQMRRKKRRKRSENDLKQCRRNGKLRKKLQRSLLKTQLQSQNWQKRKHRTYKLSLMERRLSEFELLAHPCSWFKNVFLPTELKNQLRLFQSRWEMKLTKKLMKLRRENSNQMKGTDAILKIIDGRKLCRKLRWVEPEFWFGASTELEQFLASCAIQKLRKP